MSWKTRHHGHIIKRMGKSVRSNGIVADYFVQMRENGDYIPDSHEIKHVQETMQLLGDIGDRHD